MTIYVYSNETGDQVASYDGADNAECERKALADYCSNDYHVSYVDVAHSNVA